MILASFFAGLLATPTAGAEDSRAPFLVCNEVAQVPHTMRLHAGVYTEEIIASAPLDIRMPAAFDGNAYIECLVDQGALKRMRDDAYLAAVVECREEGAGTAITRLSPQGRLRIGEEPEGYDACVRGKLADVEVEILPRD